MPLDQATLAQAIADRLNAAEVDMHAPLGACDILEALHKDLWPELDSQQSETLLGLARLFLSLPRRRGGAAPAAARFTHITSRETVGWRTWELALGVSGQLEHPVLGPYMDDRILADKLEGGATRDVPGFEFVAHRKRTIERYLAKLDWLLAMPEDRRAGRWGMAARDAIGRVAELVASDGEAAIVEQVLAHCESLARHFRGQQDWPELLGIVEAFATLHQGKDSGHLLGDEARERFREQALACARAFAGPDGLFHAITHATSIARLLSRDPASAAARDEERKLNIELLEAAARHQADAGNHAAAAAILEEAVEQAHRGGDEDTADRLSALQARHRTEWLDGGEAREVTTAFEVPESDFGAFLRPFAEAASPEAALKAWIEHPDFVHEYKWLRAGAESEVPLLAHFVQTAVLHGSGLKLAGMGEGRSGPDLQAALGVLRFVKVSAAIYLAQSLAFLGRERGVTAETVVGCLRSWKLADPDGLEVAAHGIRRHFEGDYVSAIHILVPRFEGMLRRAFQLAGYPDAIESSFSRASGVGQRERTLGKFLSRPDIVEALREDLAMHFRFVFIGDPGEKLIGLNLRNEVAHGLVEPSSLDEATSALVLHCLLLLTTLKERESMG